MRLWLFPIILTTAIQLDFINTRLHGPYAQRIVRQAGRRISYWQLYCHRILSQMGILIFLLLVYTLTRAIRQFPLWPLDLPNLALSLMTFLVLFSIQFLISLYVSPLIGYLGLNIYVLVSLSIPGIDYRSPWTLILFPNALMASRISQPGSYWLTLGLVLIAALAWGQRRFEQMDLI